MAIIPYLEILNEGIFLFKLKLPTCKSGLVP